MRIHFGDECVHECLGVCLGFQVLGFVVCKPRTIIISRQLFQKVECTLVDHDGLFTAKKSKSPERGTIGGIQLIGLL